MPDETLTLRILPNEKWTPVKRETTARDALLKSGIVLHDYCGGEGRCGKCRVQFLEGASEPTTADREFLTPEELSEGYRLACQARLKQDAVIFVPVEHSRPLAGAYVHDVKNDLPPEPEVKKIHLRLSPATIEHQLADFDLLREALKIPSLKPEYEFLKKLPHILRSNGYDATVTLFGDNCLDIEAGDTTYPAGLGVWGACIDIGTTTIGGALHHLDTGRLATRTGRLNPQTVHGADVVSRIMFASLSPANLDEIRQMVLDCINDILSELCKSAGIGLEAILHVTLAGNTTMEHLFLGIPTDGLPVAPYVPVFKDGLIIPAADAGLKIHPRARIYVFPAIGGFVGGDTVADLLVAGLENADKPSLMIDVGTNGEIVLGNRGRLMATSAAAGPAFEGRNIQYGMRAERGAIDRVVIEDGLAIHTIEEVPAAGICGSGLISAVSALSKAGMIDSSGRFITDTVKGMSERFSRTEGGFQFLLAGRNEGASRDIYIHQNDVRQFQLAKGAIAAATVILMKEFGVAAEKLDKIYIAGAFGNFIDPADAIRVGLVPVSDEKRITFIGNAALAGAGEVLLRADMRRRAETLARRVEFLELAGRPDFQDAFARAMIFI